MKTLVTTLLVLLGICILTIGGFVCNHLENAADQIANNSIVNYEEFQEVFNTCAKLNTDLCNMRDLPDSDKMFEQFSKAQRINTIKSQLNRWVEDYNGKSNMWTRSVWKSSTLPYQISVDDYPCYNK